MGLLFRPREWAVQEETLSGKAVQLERTPVLHMLTLLFILFHSRDRNVFRGVRCGIYPRRERLPGQKSPRPPGGHLIHSSLNQFIGVARPGAKDMNQFAW
jgi:hypothetical protein